jgi:hypothetical protein
MSICIRGYRCWIWQYNMACSYVRLTVGLYRVHGVSLIFLQLKAVFCSSGAYRLTIQQMDLDPREMVKYGLVFIFGSASLFTLFVTFRCIAFLTIPTLCTHPGRLFINAILVQQIISGTYD